MSTLTRYLLAFALVAFLAGCGDDDTEPIEPGGDDPQVSVDAEPEEAAEYADDLMGTWVIAEQNGQTPPGVTTMEFMDGGEVVITAPNGVSETRSYTLAEDYLVLQGGEGDERYQRFESMAEDAQPLIIDEALGEEIILRDPDNRDRNLVLRRPDQLDG